MSSLPLLPGGPGGPGEPCLPGGPSCPFTPETHKQAAMLKLHCPMTTVTSHSGSFHSNQSFFSVVLYLWYFYSICDEDCSIINLYRLLCVLFQLQQMTQMKSCYMAYRGRKMQ